jgi:hypothetical protein
VVEGYEWRNMLLPWLQEGSMNLGAAHGAAWIYMSRREQQSWRRRNLAPTKVAASHRRRSLHRASFRLCRWYNFSITSLANVLFNLGLMGSWWGERN